ncbi:MAG: hypothetical protein OEZ38_00745 [Gammaproteobacteria bacterium]|nr:hypothetical protein [Gammaproteobacteria bacterium]
MSDKLMILPSKQSEKIRLIKIPDDYEEHEVYRFATGLIAGIEEQIPDYDWDDIIEALEEHGFAEVEFILGPEI